MTRRQRLWSALAFGMFVAWAPRAWAQDPFEIEVYPYETAAKGAWELETHVNYAGLGTRTFEGTVAPSQHQFHLALELTRGLTAHWEVSAYVLAAHRPDVGPDFAGWRLRSRVRVPESWRLPANISMSGELGVPQPAYDENALTFEITPAIEKRVGRLLLDVNPSLERDLHGPDSRDGWEFEPKGRIGYDLSKVVTLNLEYYGATGPLSEPLPANAQTHQFFPGVDLRLGDDFVWNLGVGVGATSAGNRLTFKSRVEMPLGGERR